MKNILVVVALLLISTPLLSQESTDTTTDSTGIFGITGTAVDLGFIGLDLDIITPFYQKGISSLAFKISLFTYIRGNHFFSPNIVAFAPLFELQYRIHTKKGFFFAMETGIGPMHEFFTKEVFSVEQGFHRSLGITYGLFSSAIRIGGTFGTGKYKAWKMAFMLGYRMQFPFNLSINHLILTGLSLSYSFDLKKGGL